MVWVQFAKSPEIGQVKTRLAASVGDTKALDAHLTLSFAVNCQLRAIESTCPPSGLRSEQHHIRLAVAGSRGLEWSLDRLKDKGLSFDSAVMQQGLTLGDRMSRELSAALAHADYSRSRCL